MYTHVIFDLDGTLLNTIEDLADAANYVCMEHGWPVHETDEFKKMVGNGIPLLMERCTPKELTAGERAEALEEFMEYYDSHSEDKTKVYPGVPEAVRMLKAAGVKVAVLSNKADAIAKVVVESYYPGTFDLIQGACDGFPMKPDPGLLHSMLDRMSADRERTLFVGDSMVDIRTGKNCGLNTCGVLWGFRDREELKAEGASVIIDRPEQLIRVVTGTDLLLPEQTAQAARLLQQGRLVALPTETVYGLASDAVQEKAVQANFDAKKRPGTKPLNVLVDGMSMVQTICSEIPSDAYRLAEAFWPGPLTMILSGNGTLPDLVSAGGTTQGVRCPDHPVTLEVIRMLRHPLACPSANLSGLTSPKTAEEVLAQLAGRIDAVLDGGRCQVGVESTILDLTVRPYRILRRGGLEKSALESVLGKPIAESTGAESDF